MLLALKGLLCDPSLVLGVRKVAQSPLAGVMTHELQHQNKNQPCDHSSGAKGSENPVIPIT